MDYVSWHALSCFKCEKRVGVMKGENDSYILCPNCYDRFLKEIPEEWQLVLPPN